MSDDVRTALEFVRQWQENDQSGKSFALRHAVVLRNYILSPPAPGPGLDADGFVLRVMKAGAEYGIPEVTADNLDRLKEIRDRFASELRSHLAPGAADDGEEVTEEWLRSVGFVGGRCESDLVLPPIVRGLNVRNDIVNEYWVVRTYPIPDENKPRTRGHVRRLCAALGIPLPAPAPNERNGE